MQVILTEDVFQLGRRGQVVNVAPGFARNYLIPRGLAVLATPGNVKMVEQQRVAFAKREAKDREAAEILAGELSQLHLVIGRRAGETGVLFGSVTAKDLAEVLATKGITLDRRKILLDHPIKQIGNYQVEVRPHTEVEARLLVSVVPQSESNESSVLARGEDSDRVVEDLDAKVAGIQRLQGTAVPGSSGS
ncbi:MAG TPA: 50S ribosomal protein L9 [Acidobacteriota bacterium]|nr:50S ribosomal protein L9 [Acidobacteriota bacterium]HRR26379.1 50S ribosomal protein L9 [Acidobacteriota bacterium]HRR56603.1 50S ribosomal protein L9 [Acidobacteriota bacterium]HRV07173.1 50S ribosomal protein L9 [Acidobacteriota bacterium]